MICYPLKSGTVLDKRVEAGAVNTFRVELHQATTAPHPLPHDQDEEYIDDIHARARVPHVLTRDAARTAHHAGYMAARHHNYHIEVAHRRSSGFPEAFTTKTNTKTTCSSGTVAQRARHHGQCRVKRHAFGLTSSNERASKANA